MPIPIYIWGLVALAMSSGVVAGVFMSFSDFVMRALVRSQPVAGIEAMQIINREVYRSVFMVLLLGLVPVSILAAALGFHYAAGPGAGWLIAASVLYCLGVFLVTVIGNVPMNQTLDGLPLDSDGARDYWPDYVRVWSRWNHLRTGAAAATSVCYSIAAVILARPV